MSTPLSPRKAKVLSEFFDDIEASEDQDQQLIKQLYTFPDPWYPRAEPLFITQGHDNARLEVSKARYDIVTLYGYLQRALFKLKKEGLAPQMVSQYKRLLTDTCLLKLRFLEAECTAYYNNSHINGGGNPQGYQWNLKLIDLYRAVYLNMLDC
ncbi:hypothetical protein BGX33_006072 [Mortierella sp. NVP41]|nr:hypothetical protein BGX33_006072 [Mortierella sp. NVP41]